MWLDQTKLRALAKEHGWDELDHQPEHYLLSFTKDKVGQVGKVRLNIWYSTGTVGTAMNHPKHGPTQLYRKHCDYDRIAKIMANPRVHTTTQDPLPGYRQKNWPYLNNQPATPKPKKKPKFEPLKRIIIPLGKTYSIVIRLDRRNK